MEFVKRPVAVTTLTFFIFFCVLANTGADPKYIILTSGIVFALILPAAVILKGRNAVFLRYACLLCAGILASSLFFLAVFLPASTANLDLVGKQCKVSGTVTREFWKGNGDRCVELDVSEADGKERRFKAALITDADASVGDRVTAKCDFDKIVSGESFDGKRYYLSYGVNLQASADYVIVTGKDDSLKIRAAELSGKLSSILHKGLSEDSAALADAVLLGNRGGLSDGVKRDFSRIGISHLIAISGMHVSFIFAALSVILKAFKLGKRKIAALTIPFLIFYMILTGLSPSVVRASVIAVIASITVIFGISYDGATALAVCGAGMVIIDPFASLSIGMQMSFAACAGCLAGMAILKRLGIKEKLKGRSVVLRFFGKIASSVIFTLSIVLFVLPVELLYFDEVSLVSPVTNLLFIPAVSVVLYLAVLLLLTSPFSPLFSALSFVADKYISALLSLSRGVSGVRGMSVSLRYPFAPYIVTVLSVAIVVIALGKRRTSAVAACLALFCIASYGAGSAVIRSNEEKYVTFVRVGNCKSEMILVSSRGETLLCDISDGNSSCLNAALGEMRKLYITELDSYLMVNYGEKNYKALVKVSEKTVLKRAYLLPPREGERYYDKAVNYLEEHGVEVVDSKYLPEKIASGAATLSFSQAPQISGAPKNYACFRVEGENEAIAYLGSDWKRYSPSAPQVVGRDADYVIYGSSGPEVTAYYGDNNFIDNCKIYSFENEENYSYSALVLKLN